MDGLLQDLRLAVRYALRGGVVPFLAVLCLGLGIGLNTGVFTLLRGALYRAIPLEDADRLVWVWSTSPVRGEDTDEITFADVTALRETGAFTALEVIRGGNGVLTDGDAERVEGFVVTPGLFPMLGVQPQLGRNFLPEEGAESGLEAVALISDALWKNKYGGDPAVVGSTIHLNGRPLEVVGVMPERFGFPDTGDLWLPMVPDDWTDASRFVEAVGRLAPGMTLDELRARAAAISTEMAASRPETHRGYELVIQSVRESMTDAGARRAMHLMMGAVAFVLLIACVNVASLMLARAGDRGREVAVRAALGATRARIVRQLLTEALVLAAVGAVMGWMLALWFVDAAVARIPEELPYWLRFDVDAPVVLFTAGVTVATALLFGLIPALQASRLDLSSRMGGRGRVVGPSRMLGGLVGVEVALSLVLLVGAGLLMRSALRITRADIGIPTESILSMRIALAGEQYTRVAERVAFVTGLGDRIGALPDVVSAVVTTSIPADDGGATGRVRADLGDPIDAAPIASLIGWTGAGPSSLGAGLLDGRGFTTLEEGDTAAAVAVVGTSLADRLWPAGDPIGRTLFVEAPRRAEPGSPGGMEDRPLRVVGVVEDLVYEELSEQTPVSRLQVHVPYATMRNRTIALLVRGRGDPSALVPAARGQIRTLDPTLAPYEVMSMEDRRRLTFWEQRLLGGLFAQLAVVALALAGAGVYGVVAYGVARRRRELGVRLVLGASPRGLLGSVVRATAVPAVIGGAAGLLVAFWLSRLLVGLLYGIDPSDPVTFAIAAGAMLGIALLAAWLPARRALKLDPADALRAE